MPIITPSRAIIRTRYRQLLDDWDAIGAPKNKIVSMAGKLEFSTVAQIDKYAEEAKKQGITTVILNQL